MRVTLDEAIKRCYDVAKTNSCDCGEEHRQLAEWLEKLKEYEDAEEQGLLVRLPCKLGDTVYFFSDVLEEVCEAKVIKVEQNYYTPSRMFWFTIEYFSKLIGTQVLHKPISEVLNNTVFLTREEAEQALKEAEE